MKLWKITRWTFFYILFGWLAWHAVNGHEAAGRVVGFWVWLGFAILLLALFFDETKKQIRAKGRSVPGWLSHGAGAAIVAWFVWHGWTALAVAALFSEIFEAYLFTNEKDEA